LSRKKILARVVGCVCALAMLMQFTGCQPDTGEASVPEQYAVKGYSFAEYEGESPKGDSFLACGSDGRLDRIYADKSVENILLPDVDNYLTQILVRDGITIVGGQSGTLLYSTDGKEFTACKGATKSDIVGLASFQGKYYAGTRNGVVLVSDDGVSWKKCASLSEASASSGAAENWSLSSTPEIISFTATADYIAGITADTDIFMSSDGTNWNAMNYGETIGDGMTFTKIVNLSPSFFILGYYTDDPGWPFMIFSDSGGEIWSAKSLDEINEEEPGSFAPLNINHICVFEGELRGVCNSGRVLTITSCSTCNEISELSEADMRGIALSGTNMLVVGDNFEFTVLNALDFREDEITPEQAYEDSLYNGAVIVDVRSKEEFDERHIKGALHIPVEEIEARLATEFFDVTTEIIFYCAAGNRSKTALKTAQQLGYLNVFNLGGLSDWPYETE